MDRTSLGPVHDLLDRRRNNPEALSLHLGNVFGMLSFAGVTV
jgi:hypothetical protein